MFLQSRAADIYRPQVGQVGKAIEPRGAALRTCDPETKTDKQKKQQFHIAVAEQSSCFASSSQRPQGQVLDPSAVMESRQQVGPAAARCPHALGTEDAVGTPVLLDILDGLHVFFFQGDKEEVYSEFLDVPGKRFLGVVRVRRCEALSQCRRSRGRPRAQVSCQGGVIVCSP